MKTLDTIQRSDLEPYVFPGTDAAVMHVDRDVMLEEIKEKLYDLSAEHRIYPKDHAWEVKFPYWYAEELCRACNLKFDTIFEREPKGWDHEHCNFCEKSIAIGEISYTVEDGDDTMYVVCTDCACQCGEVSLWN